MKTIRARAPCKSKKFGTKIPDEFLVELFRLFTGILHHGGAPAGWKKTLLDASHKDPHKICDGLPCHCQHTWIAIVGHQLTIIESLGYRKLGRGMDRFSSPKYARYFHIGTTFRYRLVVGVGRSSSQFEYAGSRLTSATAIKS